jgi:GTP1/Obg family GTP-binding protein
MSAERYTHLQRIIEMLQKNLNIYEEQEAAFGKLYVPPFLKRQIDDTREELEKAKEELATLEPVVNAQRQPIPSIPHNLPPKVELVGCLEEKAKALQVLRSPTQSVLINGMLGIGKTALAKDVAYALWDADIFQAIVWTSSEDQPLTLSGIIDTIGYLLDHPYLIRLPAEEKPAAALRLLQSQHVLLIVDGFEKIKDQQVEWFLGRIPSPSSLSE